MKATNLTASQIQQAWDWACNDGGYSMSASTIYDFLGAKLERTKYDQDDINGWCIEYVIPPTMLNDFVGCIVNPFTEANVRVLNIMNFTENVGHRNGEYSAFYSNENGKNKRRFVHQSSKISEEGILALRTTYGLTDEFIQSYFNR